MREKYIAQMARKMGLDPKAVLAIASHEGLSGGVGDGGHAFGPGQLNDAGGVLTGAPASHHSNKWAWSDAGIQFWLKGVAQVARGLKGEAAVRAIATRYERPANPAAEIADAMAHYGKVAGSNAGGPIMQQGQVLAHGAKRATVFDAQLYKNQAASIMLSQAAARANGQDPNANGDLFSQLEMARKAATMKVNTAGNAAGQPIMGGPGGGIGGKVVKMAAKQIGVPYVWGGEGPKGFDCSGLVQYVYGKLGIKLPRTAAEQGQVGKAVNYRNMQPGDLLVEKNGAHVVIYAGNNQVIAAPHTGVSVMREKLSYFPPGQYNVRRIVAK